MSDDGSEPLLSGEETDALLDAMRQSAGSAPEKAVEGLDLVSSEPRLRSALSASDLAARRLVVEYRRLLLRQLGCPTAITPQPAEITPYSVLREGIAPGSAVATLSDRDGGLGLVILSPELVSFMLDRRMGAPLKLGAENEDAEPEVRENLSNVDRRVVRLFLSDLLESFSRAWCDRPVAIQVEKIISLEDLPDLPQFEPLLRITTTVSPSGGVPGTSLFALTANMVSSTLPAPAKLEAPPPTPSQQRHMKARLKSTEVMLAAFLGTSRSTVREILSLDEGDVIRLGSAPAEPINVYSGGIIVARGMPVVHHGNLAIEVRETA